MKTLPLFICLVLGSASLFAQQDCDTFLGTITDLNNNCGPCTNGMERLLRPFIQYKNARDKTDAKNDAIDEYLDKRQAEVNRLTALQRQVDRILNEWGMDDLNKQPLMTDPQYLQNTIDDMRAYVGRYPEQSEWFEIWITRFEELIRMLKEYDGLKSRANQLAERIRIDAFGNLGDISFDCCPGAVEDGKFRPEQLDRLSNLYDEMKVLYDDCDAYRSKLVDKCSELTELLLAQLSQRQKEEREAIDRRDQFANGVSGFLVSKMQNQMSVGISQALAGMGIAVDQNVQAAIDALSTAMSNGIGAVGSGGGLGGVTGEATQMIVEQAFDQLSPNDRKALGIVSNAVMSQIASSVVSAAINNAIESSLGRFLIEGLSDAAIPVTLLDRMLTIAPYLWEDANRMILQGGFDRILLGLIQGIRLTYGTARFPLSGPLDAYIEKLKGPKERAIDICLAERTFDPPNDQGAMVRQFWMNAFPDQYVISLSENERFEVLQSVGKPYLRYFLNNKIRFNIRFGCYCGILKEKVEVTPEGIDPLWENIKLTGERMKPGYPFTAGVDRGFPWLPVGIGVAAAGVGTYVLLKEDEQTCDFTIVPQVVSSHCGFADGMATIVPSRTGNYTYLWSNGNTTPTISEVEGGNYSVTVTLGTGGCNRVANVLIPTDPFLANVTVSGAHCGVSDGSASVAVTPVAQYSYHWSNDNMTASQTNLAAGDYRLTITLNGQCTQESIVTVPELAPLFTIALSSVPASCGASDGSVTATVSPPGTYDFAWSTSGSGMTLSNVASGDYTVTVTIPGTECEKTATTTVSETGPNFTIDFTSSSASCGMSDGSAEAIVTPSGDYTFLWSDNSNTAMLTDAAPGNYSVTVTIAGTECQKVGMVTIDEMAPDITLQLNATPADCGEKNGAVIVEALPPANYMYEWSSGDMTAAVTGLAGGEYTVTVSLPGLPQCSVTGTIEIPENTIPLEVTISTTSATCGIADGTASVTISPDGEYQYNWSTGDITADVSELHAGVYFVTITQVNGCNKPVVFNVPVPGQPAEYVLNVESTAGNCVGDSANITLELQTPGSGPMEIVATGPDGAHTVSAPAGTVNLNTFFSVVPGAWQITVRDISLDSMCTDQAVVQVDTLNDLTGLDDMYETTTGQTLNGNVLDNDTGPGLHVTDNTQPTGGTVMVNPDGSFLYTPPAMAGIYTFTYTVTDTCGNTATPTVTIQVTSLDCLFDASFNVTPTDCGLSTGSIETLLIPPGMYVFSWSNGDTTQDISNLAAGQYQVTITSIDLNCTKEYVVQVDEVPITYVLNVSSAPGNCTGEGEITLEIATPGAGPIVVVVEGPEGTQSFELAAGTYQLSTLMNIPSGDYTIMAYDSTAGEMCAQTVQVTVDDNTEFPMAENDQYVTDFETPVMGNVLDNDTGLNLMVVSNTPATGGTVVINPDGSFTFTPEMGFTGTAFFSYVVEDACGHGDDALVQIEVGSMACDFNVEFINTNATCGLGDGSSQVVVDPPGNYAYQWSTGQTTSLITDLAAGIYSVTITDLDVNCDLSLETEIFEDPPMYVSNIVITQPVCPNPGEIAFDVSSAGGGPYDISVTHPGGVDMFTVAAGTVTLSDVIAIVEGEYTINVVDQAAGPSCIDGFMATIDAATMLEIMLVSVTPPSSPSASDGIITASVTMPGVPPYTILLNDVIWGVTTDMTFSIDGLFAGSYTVQLQDFNGCLSNVLEVDVPITSPLQLEIGLVPVAVPASLFESPRTHGQVIELVKMTSLCYKLNNLHNITAFSMHRVAIDSSPTAHAPMVTRITQLVELGRYEFHSLDLRAHAGFSMDVVQGASPITNVTVQGSARKRVGKAMLLAGSVMWMGQWVPVVEVGVRVVMDIR